MVRLEFTIELEYRVLQPAEFIFKIHAVETPRQKVGVQHLAITPGIPYTIERCGNFGNQHLRLHAEPGPLQVGYSASVEINHHLAQPAHLSETPVAKLPLDVLQYLYPSRYCPSDRLYQIALREFGGLQPGYGRAQAICEWVRGHTRFQSGATNSFHCALDTLNSGVGVCRDFAHLMIAFCRALNIPARFVTSIDHGADPSLGPPDFHAYVEAYLSGRWYIFDPTGLCPTTGLLRIATGRDAGDAAFATFFGQVMGAIPRVTVSAHEDAAAGVALPCRTDLAVSTSGAAETRQTVHSGARLDDAAMPAALPPSSLPARTEARIPPS